MLKVEHSALSIDDIVANPVFTADTRARIQSSDVLVVPVEDFRGTGKRGFASEAPALSKWIRKELPKISITFAENTGEEQIIALHSNELWLGTIWIASEILLPIVLGVIANFVSARLKHEEATVHIMVMVNDKKRGISKTLHYNGPATGLTEAIKTVDINDNTKE
jgi:hypothetical protein